MISEYSVPWVIAKHPHGMRDRVEVDRLEAGDHRLREVEHLLRVSMYPDGEFDLAEVEALLQRVLSEISQAEDRAKVLHERLLDSRRAAVKRWRFR